MQAVHELPAATAVDILYPGQLISSPLFQRYSRRVAASMDLLINTTAALPSFFDEFTAPQAFIFKPASTWTTKQMLTFPWLCIIPTEILSLISTTMIFLIGSSPWGMQLLGDNDLPHGRKTGKPLGFTDYSYIWFNRLVMLPFVAFLVLNVVCNSSAIVWDMDALNWKNGFVMFVVVFSLSDFTYYVAHRIVHRVPWLYAYVHKHHHQERQPIRGWADTCNAHPTDFFYTGFCTSPMSTLWLMPAGSVHIVAIAACLWVNSFLGSLGHCRLDINTIFFSTRFHAGHHAYSKYNFAQNIDIWDRLFNTYRDYSETVNKKRKARDKVN